MLKAEGNFNFISHNFSNNIMALLKTSFGINSLISKGFEICRGKKIVPICSQNRNTLNTF